jgi:hypothetical protein
MAFIPCGFNNDLWYSCLNVDTARYFDDASKRLTPEAESMIVLANPVLPHSEGEIVLESADPGTHPAIRMNYFGDIHDMKVMLAVLRRALEVVAHWPAHRQIGSLMVPPCLAEKHGYRRAHPRRSAGGPALHFSITVYHLTSTAGSRVVDPRRASALEAARSGCECNAQRQQSTNAAACQKRPGDGRRPRGKLGSCGQPVIEKT